MTPRTILTGFLALVLGLLLPVLLSAQRGNIIVPIGASIIIPQGAVVCADTIFANGPGHGTLTLADPSGLCSGSVVIPVELLIFSAALQDDAVLLSWATAAETQNLGFEVQRWTNQGEWSVLGFVDGHGSTVEPHSYGYADNLEGLGAYCCELRYRLKQIDLDGRDELSPEVEVRLDLPLPHFALEGYPLPCDEALTIRVTLGEAAATSIRLHDITGRVVMVIAQDAVLPAGNHSMLVRTAGMMSGLYLITVENREGRRTEKVLIRH